MPTLYVFTTPDCVACTELKPYIAALVDDVRTEQLAADAVLVNAAERPDLTDRFWVKTVPCVVVVDDAGHRVAGFTGSLINREAVRRALTLAASPRTAGLRLGM